MSMFQAGKEEMSKPSDSNMLNAIQEKARSKSKRPRRIFMKRRRARLEDSRRASKGIRKRVRTLKKLVPQSESMRTTSLDGLFTETADYILSLQMRVKVMQIMVNVLTGSDD